MASDYGLNFGFRRSDESLAIREGRFKTPVDSNLLLGTPVEIDPANEGYLKQSAANAAPVTGQHGLLVQELNMIGSVFSAAPLLGHDSYDLGNAKGDKLSVMLSGPGVKVWFKNTAAYSRGDRSKAAVNILDTTSLVVGDQLGWNGTAWARVDGTTVTKGWATVTNVSTDYCEAVLTF